MEFEGEAADEAEELFGDQKQKNPGCYPGLICFVAVCVVLGLFALVLSSGEEQLDSYPPDPSYGGFFGSFEPGEQQLVVPLTPYADTEVDTIGPCAMRLVYDNTPGSVEFATADQHNRRQGCNVAYSVDFNGYYTDWEVYDRPGETIVVRAEPGTHIRGIAFAQCYPPSKEPPLLPEFGQDGGNPPPSLPSTAGAPVTSDVLYTEQGSAENGCFTVWRPLPGLAGLG